MPPDTAIRIGGLTVSVGLVSGLGVSFWRTTREFFEKSGEIMDAGKPQLLRDLGNRQLCFREKPLGFINLEFQKEMDGPAICLIFENTLDCADRKTGCPADICHG